MSDSLPPELRLPDLPLLEFDPSPTAMIQPHPIRTVGEVPDRAVVCFFQDVIESVCGEGRAEVVGHFMSELGRHPLYRLETDDGAVAVFHPGVGAPLAAGLLEEAIATGCSTLVACGGAGAVTPGLALGHVVVPDAAVRDEGTSFRYLAPSREVEADPACLAHAVSVLERRGVPHAVGKTWTTDGFYRETKDRIARRRDEGCLTVEMEVAAFFAVSRFRGVRFAQYLYAGDDVSGESWDHRRWQTSTARADLFGLAVEAALTM